MILRGAIFPVLLAASLVLHGWVLRSAKWPGATTDPGVMDEVVTEVVLVEELPPPPELPEPEVVAEPEVVPEPEPVEVPPEPAPPVEEILAAPESTMPPVPKATPAPTATPKPKATPKSKPLPKPVPKRPSRPSVPDAPKPVVIQNSPPSYPEFARRKGWAGRVIVRVAVDARGMPSKVSVAMSSGFAVLDQAALRAVKKWRFRPQVAGGVAVAGTVDVPVNFSLRR